MPYLYLALAALLVVPLPILAWMRFSNHRVRRRAEARLLATVPPATERFTAAQLEGLPEPVRRFLGHAIAEGTPVASGAHVDVTLSVREQKTDPESPYVDYRLREVITTTGLAGDGWQQDTRTANRATFWYADGVGASREAWFDLIPAILASGESVTRLLRVRTIHELIWLPTALLPRPGIEWRAIDDSTIEVTVELDGDRVPLRLVIDGDGRLLEITGPRFGSVGTPERQFIATGLKVEEEATFGGLTVPSRMIGGWWWGTERYNESTGYVVHGVEPIGVD